MSSPPLIYVITLTTQLNASVATMILAIPGACLTILH
jgi:hypothetical protein